MPIQRQRQWNCQMQQQALLEYDLARRCCPDGIYLSMTPGNHSLWSGVLFVRKGPYAPSVLRFQIAFPQKYPEVPPLILLTNDVFHPLVTPLTTYTYSTSSSSADPVSATDDERLLPGGFNLRHGFPYWYGKKESLRRDPSTPTRSPTKLERPDSARSSDGTNTKLSFGAGGRASVFLPPPKDEGTSIDDIAPSIIAVLWYVKKAFEDEKALDNLPLEVAGNPGAWHAWQAHRRKSKAAKGGPEGTRSQSNTPKKAIGTPERPRPGGWNWDGVWSERVKRGVTSSLSEAMLFGGVDGDDLIHFLDVDEETTETLRRPFQGLDTGIV